jgi:hypothetical protein
MVSRSFFVGETQKSRSVVVQDVALLIARQKWRRLDSVDSALNDPGPHHLVGSEHDALSESGLYDSLQEAVKLRSGKRKQQTSDFGIDLRVSPKDGQQIIQHGPARVHDVKPVEIADRG